MSVNKKLLRLAWLSLVSVVLSQCVLTDSAFAIPKKRLNIQRWNTSQGVPVYLVETHQLPMVDVNIMFAAGSAYDGAKAGLAALTNSLLFEGTKNHSADQIAEAFEQVGAINSSETSQDYAAIAVRSLSRSDYLGSVTSLTQEILSAPTFAKKDFKRIMDQTIVALQSSEQQPDAVASRVFFETLYGSSPYGHTHLGTLDSVKKITQSDVQEFFKKYYVRENAKIVIVGDLTKDQASDLSEKLASNLLSGKKAIPQLSTSPITQTTVKTVKFPSTQTTALIGQVGIGRPSNDYYAVKVGNNILGGGSFNSRLVKNVRVNKGLAYFVASYFLTLKEKGPFIVILQTRNNKASEAVNIAQETLKEFVKNGPKDEELALAKRSIIGTFPLAISSNSAILANVSNIMFYDLPLDYLDKFVGHIQSITKDQVKSAFQRMLQMDKLLTVTVGDVG